jgi:hypothetical protein
MCFSVENEAIQGNEFLIREEKVQIFKSVNIQYHDEKEREHVTHVSAKKYDGDWSIIAGGEVVTSDRLA